MSHAVPTSQYRRVFRVFLSSPGDVTDERALARHLLKDELPYEAFLRGQVMFEPVSWDDPAAPVPMQADRTPQETVNRSRPRPSECDFVVIILWSRLGTPLPEEHCKADGGRYLSGTEWEYEDALKATPRPNILVYRRMETPMMAVNDPAKDEKAEQWERLERFFSRFKNPDGSLQGGVTEYQTPSMFADRLKSDLRELVAEMEPQPSHFSKLDGMISPETAGAETWPGSPYPGLRAFKPDEGPIFVGRGREGRCLDRPVARSYPAVLGCGRRLRDRQIIAHPRRPDPAPSRRRHRGQPEMACRYLHAGGCGRKSLPGIGIRTGSSAADTGP
jgi:hypothetical protein